MITESMAIQGLYAISLSLTPFEKWKAASSFHATGSSEKVFTILAIMSLIIAVTLLFWVFTKYKLAQHSLELKVKELAVKNARLRRENATLTAATEELRQENAELYKKQIEALENIINSVTPTKEIPALISDKSSPE